MTINERFERQQHRRISPIDLLLTKASKEYGVYTTYIINAMKPIEKKYTDKLIEQGNRVENQLQKRLADNYPDIEFERQGSVSNLTHIKYASDVDLLVIIDKFVMVETSQPNSTPYSGNVNEELLELRKQCVKELKLAFYEATVDDSGANSIELEGGSLACKVDVVPSAWYETNLYKQTYIKYEKGIQVLNKKNMIRNTNFPFKFNYLLDINDKQRNGVTRMIIRLLKTIKADSDNIDFSSYDIASIVYRIPNEFLRFNLKNPLDILQNLFSWMQHINADYNGIRQTLKVVDDSRLIFDKDEKVIEFTKLFRELISILSGAKSENNNQVILTEKHLY